MTDTTTSAPPPTESSESSAPASLVDATKKASLLRQIEYYFSDVSFPYDEFLSSQKDEAGSVAVAVLAGSPRIVSMTPDLTPQQREAVLLAVVTESEDVKVVGERIARVWPLPADDPKADHSVYLSGVPKSADEAALRSMLEGCRPSFGRAVSIRRLRDVQRDRAYSGQIFVECEDAEKAATLVRAATKGACGISCNKARLLRDFFDKQDVTIREQKEKRAAKLAAGGGTSSSATSGTKRPAEGEAGEAEPETAEQAAARELKEEKEQALLVRFQKAGPSTDRETLEVICGAYGKVAFVDFQRGDTDGTVRFENAEGASKALAALRESTPDVGGEVASWREMTREESQAYWQTYRDRKAAQHAQKRHRGGGKGKGKGGRGNYRGGGRAHGRS